MSSAGINPLAILAPDLYAKQLAIQRRQALAQSLMQQGSESGGNAAYGGLANAGKSLLGAFLAKRGDQAMANLYAPQTDTSQAPSQPPQQPGQISNAPMPTAPQSPSQPPVAPQGGPSPQVSNSPSPNVAMGQALQGRTIPSVMNGAIADLPGMSHTQSIMAYFQSPQAYYTALAAANAPTPDQKNANAAYGTGTPQAKAALQGVVQKAGSVEVRPEGYVLGPDGKITYGPNEASNVYYTTGPNNEPIAHPIQGGAEAAAQAAGQKTGAEEQNKIVEVTLPDGRKVPMRVGDVVPFGSANAPGAIPGIPNIDRNNPLNVSPGGQVSTFSTPTAGLGKAWDTLGQYQKKGINTVAGIMNTWAPMTDGKGNTINPNTPQNITMISQKLGVSPNQVIDLGNPNIKGQVIDLMRPTETGNRYSPQAQNQPPQIGETTAQREVNEAAGTAATGNAHAQAVTQSTLKAIDGLIALNDQTPDSTGISPDWKSDINKRVPGIFKGDAGAMAQWNQLNGIGVLGGLKQLQGLGRLDLPEVNQVVKTNGVPADVPRAERLKILQNLKTMVQNNLASSQNTVANLNRPGITTNQVSAPMGNFGGAHPQDIVDELRRRGIVK